MHTFGGILFIYIKVILGFKTNVRYSENYYEKNAIAGKSVRADTRRSAASKYAFKAGYYKEIRIHEVEVKENRKRRFN